MTVATPKLRAIVTAAVAMLALALLPLLRDSTLLTGLDVFVLVVALGRSLLPWSYRFPGGALVRRVLRVLVYLLPLPLVALPPLRLSWWAVAAAVLVAAVPLLAEARTLRRNFQPAYLRLLPPLPPVERFRDLIFFTFSGLGQEYLYRYLLLFGLRELVGPVPAIVITAALFVGEHLAHRHAPWDRHDLLVHGYFGVLLGALTVASGSLAPAVIAHTLYNAPGIVQTLARPGGGSAPPRAAAQPTGEAP